MPAIRRAVEPRSRGPNPGGGVIRPVGIIGLLCTSYDVPPILYIRTPVASGRGKSKTAPEEVDGEHNERSNDHEERIQLKPGYRLHMSHGALGCFICQDHAHRLPLSFLRAAKASIKSGAPKSPGPMIPTPTSLRQSPRSTQRLTTPTDGTPPLARSIALCPHG
jgi:hypothetical protein